MGGHVYRIPSEKERVRKVGEGNFDDSWFDKKGKKIVEEAHDRCPFCHEKLEAVDMIAKRGKIVMTCNTPGCPGNMTLDPKHWNNKYRDLKRAEDRKLVWDMADIALSKPFSRLWSGPKRRI